MVKQKNKLHKLLMDNYWFVNPVTNFVAGALTGYTLEKNGIPYSMIDVGIQANTPIALGSLEYLTEKKVRNYSCDINIKTIRNSNLVGLGTFYLGNNIGRYLGKLV